MARNAPTFRTAHEQHTHAATRRHAYLWRSRVESSAPLTVAVNGLQDSVTKPSSTNAECVAAADNAGVFARELYARLVDDTQALEKPSGGALWEPALQRAMGDAVAQLQPGLGGDVDFAAVAAKGLLEKAAKVLPGLLEKVEQEEKERQERERQGQPEPSRDGLTAEDMLSSALRRQASETATEVAETKAAMAGLAPTLADAPSRKDEGDPRRMLLIERLRDDEELAKVLRLAGRLQRVHARVREMKTSDGCTEIVSVEQGGEVDRVLADHLALMADDELGDWALLQVIERKAPQYSMAGFEPMGRGPIVVLRDVSGSMEGQPHAWAAAVCILALQTGAKDGRQVTVVNYNNRVRDTWKLTVSGKGLTDMVLDIASTGTGGGTSMDPALTWALDFGGLVDERADLCIVTDGRSDSVRPDLLARIQDVKESEGLKVAGLTINGGSLSRGLTQVCDSIVDLDRGDTAQQAAKGITL